MGLIAIGDIHGCVRTLDILLERLAPAADDHLVFMGDYIDRGPDSKGVIDRLLSLRETHTRTFLRGNHEALMLGYIDHGEYDLWRINGGISTLNSYLNADHHLVIPPAHLDFIRATELYLDTPSFFFVHAGIRPGDTIAESIARGDDKLFLWERSHLKAGKLAWEKTVVCGHTPQEEPLNRDHLINVDTGCVYYMHRGLGSLTAVRLPERTFVTVPYNG